MPSPADNHIHHLHVHNALNDTPHVRLMLRRVLNEAVEAPPTLPPRAILLVPRLAPDEALPLHDTQHAHRWAAHVRTLLADLAARAQSPTAGRIPTDAPALILRDRAEWLALTLLIAAGLEPPPVRFPTLANARRRSPSAWLQNEPRLAPAALARLHDWRKREALLATLTPTEAETTLRAIAAAWGVPLPAKHLAAYAVPIALLECAALLAATPHQAHHAAWHSALHTWWLAHAAENEQEPTPNLAAARSTFPRTTAGSHEEAHKTPAQHASPPGTPTPTQPATAPTPMPEHQPKEAHETSAQHAPSPGAPTTTLPICATHSAGVLFLLNLCAWLDLPHSAPIDLTLWAWVDVFARALLAPHTDEHDPIWLWLAEMDGREPGTLPGATLPPLDTFTLPPAWLDTPAALHWHADTDTLALFTADGLWLTHAPRTHAPPALQAAQLARPYGERPREHATPPPLFDTPAAWWQRLNPTLRGWLGRAMPFIRRLWDTRTDQTPPPAILQSPHLAHIYTTATHVDVIWPMDAVSLPARLAGLDASPGWLPTVGRVVTFEFR